MRPATSGALILGLKAAAAALQFLVLVLTARWFGVAFRGELALWNATVQLVVLVVGFLAGSSIVFLAAREPSRPYLRRLLAVAYGACVLLPVAIALGAAVLGRSLGPEASLLVLVSVMTALLVVNSCVLLAGHEAWQASLVEFLRPFALVALACGLAATRGSRSPREFYVLWGAASVTSFALSLPFLAAHHRRLERDWVGPAASLGTVLRQLSGYGAMGQASNVAQFLNYRALFFALERHAGLAAVGLFSTAAALAEVLWLPANSLAVLVLNRVSRHGGAPATRVFVMHAARLAVLAMLAGAAVAAWVPVGVITALLGREFAEVRDLLVRLLPGVVTLGVSLVASSYHAGHGLYGRNLAAALAGLAVTLVGVAWLVPYLGSTGALIAMNASYLATSLWLMVALLRREHVAAGELLPRAADLRTGPGERA